MRENGGKAVQRPGIGDPGKMCVVEACRVFLVFIREVRVFTNKRRIGAVYPYRHNDAVEDLATLVGLLQLIGIQQSCNEVCHVSIAERIRRIRSADDYGR